MATEADRGAVFVERERGHEVSLCFSGSLSPAAGERVEPVMHLSGVLPLSPALGDSGWDEGVILSQRMLNSGASFLPLTPTLFLTRVVFRWDAGFCMVYRVPSPRCGGGNPINHTKPSVPPKNYPCEQPSSPEAAMVFGPQTCMRRIQGVCSCLAIIVQWSSVHDSAGFHPASADSD